MRARTGSAVHPRRHHRGRARAELVRRGHSFYVFNHLPREALGPLLENIAAWLRPGGHLLASFGAHDTPAWYGEAIGGLETFFSGYDPPVTLGLVRDAGLEIVRDELETIEEPEGPSTFLWVLARKPG